MFLSNATYLFPFLVPLAQLRAFKAKASEEFHAWKIKQEAAVLRVDKHKYLEIRSAHIGSILQKQNVVCDAEKVILIKNTFVASIARTIHLKAVSVVCWNRTKKKSLCIHCFQKFLFVSGAPRALRQWQKGTSQAEFQSALLKAWSQAAASLCPSLKTRNWSQILSKWTNIIGGNLSKNGWKPKLCTTGWAFYGRKLSLSVKIWWDGPMKRGDF